MNRSAIASFKLQLPLLTMALALGLTGCYEYGEPTEMPTPGATAPSDPCRADCKLVITLPADPEATPVVLDAEFHIVQDVPVQIFLIDAAERPGQAATELRFESEAESAFVDAEGEPMKVIPLKLDPEQNIFKARSYAQGACWQEQNGCKYTIVNTGNPARGENDPYIVIHKLP